MNKEEIKLDFYKKSQTISAGGSPYDDVFRTLVVEHHGLLLKLINEMFEDANYIGDEEVRALNNTYFSNKKDGEQDKEITDSAIEIIDHYGGKKIFHLECQSESDSTIVLRMFEYDVQIAIKTDSKTSKDLLEVNMPESGILYLRSNSNTPDHMYVLVRVPNGEGVKYQIPILKLKNYSCDEIIDKELYFLIPFYLFNFEADFAKIESREELITEKFRERYSEIYEKLKEKLESGQIDVLTHHSIIMLSKKIINALAAKKKVVKEEAEKIMGGQVLDYETKELIRTGEKQGTEKGIRASVDIMHSLGCDDDTIIKQISEKYEISEDDAKKYL